MAYDPKMFLYEHEIPVYEAVKTQVISRLSGNEHQFETGLFCKMDQSDCFIGIPGQEFIMNAVAIIDALQDDIGDTYDLEDIRQAFHNSISSVDYRALADEKVWNPPDYYEWNPPDYYERAKTPWEAAIGIYDIDGYPDHITIFDYHPIHLLLNDDFHSIPEYMNICFGNTEGVKVIRKLQDNIKELDQVRSSLNLEISRNFQRLSSKQQNELLYMVMNGKAFEGQEVETETILKAYTKIFNDPSFQQMNYKDILDFVTSGKSVMAYFHGDIRVPSQYQTIGQRYLDKVIDVFADIKSNSALSWVAGQYVMDAHRIHRYANDHYDELKMLAPKEIRDIIMSYDKISDDSKKLIAKDFEHIDRSFTDNNKIREPDITR